MGRIILLIVLSIFICSLKFCDADESKGESPQPQRYIHKCCPKGQYVTRRKICRNFSEIEDFKQLKVYNTKIKHVGTVEDMFSILDGKFIHEPEFREKAILWGSLGFTPYIIENGGLLLEMLNVYERWTPVKNENFCIDYIYRNKTDKLWPTPKIWAILNEERFSETDDDDNEAYGNYELVFQAKAQGILEAAKEITRQKLKDLSMRKFSDDNSVPQALMSNSTPTGAPAVNDEDKTPQYLPEVFVTLISCFFMILVLIVYFLLPELLNLSGMILVAFVTSLLLAFLLLVTMHMSFYTEEVCIGLTMSIYFFFIANFCWMSVMSYDIWWTFRGYAKARPIQRRGENFKFLMYCLYAWGLPLLMTIGLFILNSLDLKHLPWVITPHVPDMGCFIEGVAKFIYLYIPMLILTVCSWTFHLMTAFNVKKLNRQTSVMYDAAGGSPAAYRYEKNRFKVYIKLSIIMSLNLLFDYVTFFNSRFKKWFIYYDLYNILIGLALFLIFVCKKKIYRKLCKRYGFGKMTQISARSPRNNIYVGSHSDSSTKDLYDACKFDKSECT